MTKAIKQKVKLSINIFLNFFRKENLEVVILLVGVIIAYNFRLFFNELSDQRVAFMMGVTVFGTPTLLLYFYYKKLKNVFSRTIVVALILLTLKEFLGGVFYLLDIKFELFDNFSYGLSFYSQVGFMAAVIGLSYIRASRIDGRIFRYFCGIDTNRSVVHGLHDKKRDTSPEKSVGENERSS